MRIYTRAINTGTIKMAKHPVWEKYSLEEMLTHLAITLEWKDGYPEYEEGTVIARFHNYKIEFSSEYDTWAISRINQDGSGDYIFQSPAPYTRLLDAITEANIGGVKFRLWDKETLDQSCLSELDSLQEVLLHRTAEGKYVRTEKTT
jgi:hypothetical protein